MTEIVFDHIAIAVERMADAAAVLVGELGGAPDGGGPGREFSWACWRFAGGGRVELIEPRGDDGFLHRFLARHGPGVHHVTFKVADLLEVCAHARAQGCTVVGYDDDDPAWKVAYLHPRDALGIVVQIAQPGGRRAPRAVAPPSGLPAAPPPVTVLGLRMGVRAPDRARRLWGTLLGGEAESGVGGELVFRWPRSPLCLTVETNADAAEGPVCLEIATDRPLRLPAPVPGLGTVIAQR